MNLQTLFFLKWMHPGSWNQQEVKGRESVLPALFRLLYCCGLRCKEVRTLLCINVHTEDYYIDVIQSKGPKSRRIFISHDLAEYLVHYDARISILFPDREYYFPSGTGSCYSSQFISSNFRRFWLEAFPGFEMTTRPRAYDFRHHFAWSNLNRWAAEGMDLNVMLPYFFYAFATIETLSKSMAAANREDTGAGKKWDDRDILKKIYSL